MSQLTDKDAEAIAEAIKKRHRKRQKHMSHDAPTLDKEVIKVGPAEGGEIPEWKGLVLQESIQFAGQVCAGFGHLMQVGQKLLPVDCGQNRMEQLQISLECFVGAMVAVFGRYVNTSTSTEEHCVLLVKDKFAALRQQQIMDVTSQKPSIVI